MPVRFTVVDHQVFIEVLKRRGRGNLRVAGSTLVPLGDRATRSKAANEFLDSYFPIKEATRSNGDTSSG